MTVWKKTYKLIGGPYDGAFADVERENAPVNPDSGSITFNGVVYEVDGKTATFISGRVKEEMVIHKRNPMFRLTWKCGDAKWADIMEALRNTAGEDYRPNQGFRYRTYKDAAAAAEYLMKAFPSIECFVSDDTCAK